MSNLLFTVPPDAAAYYAQGLGLDLDAIIAGGFNFGNNFLTQWGNRAAYRSGINPAAPAVDYRTQQPPAYPQPYYPGQQPAGPQIAGGLSQLWQDAANSLGISSGTLTLLVAGGVVLLFATPPRRGR